MLGCLAHISHPLSGKAGRLLHRERAWQMIQADCEKCGLVARMPRSAGNTVTKKQKPASPLA